MPPSCFLYLHMWQTSYIYSGMVVGMAKNGFQMYTSWTQVGNWFIQSVVGIEFLFRMAMEMQCDYFLHSLLYSVTGVDRISSYWIRAASKMWAFCNYDWEETAYIWRQRWLIFLGLNFRFLKDCGLFFILSCNKLICFSFLPTSKTWNWIFYDCFKCFLNLTVLTNVWICDDGF